MRPRPMPNATDGLLAHFPFSTDFEDRTGAGFKVRNHGVRLGPDRLFPRIDARRPDLPPRAVRPGSERPRPAPGG